MNFKVGDFEYRTVEKLDCFDQLELVRKIAPVVGGIADIDLGELKAGVSSSLQSVLKALAAMPKADIMEVVAICYKVVHRITGNTSSPIWTEAAGLMYKNLGMSEMLMICYHVIKDNLENFTKGLPSASIQVLSTLYQQGAAQVSNLANQAEPN